MIVPPLVSIVIPAHNRAALLPRALQSVLAQSYPHWEVLLIDDGSTDGTDDLARTWRGRLGGRLTYVRQERQGAGNARNRGIDLARGEFVAFLDSDDEFCPQKLSRQLELFAARPSLGLVYSDYSFVDLEGKQHASAFDQKCRGARHVPFAAVAPRLNVCHGSLFDSLIEGYFIATIVGLVRRDILGREIRFHRDLTYAEEWLFYLEIARQSPAGFVDEPLCVHHFVRNSVSRRDATANHAANFKTLTVVADRLGDLLTAGQCRRLNGRIAAAARQLAFDAQAQGDFATAAAWFRTAANWQPTMATLRDLLRSAACRLELLTYPSAAKLLTHRSPGFAGSNH